MRCHFQFSNIRRNQIRAVIQENLSSINKIQVTNHTGVLSLRILSTIYYQLTHLPDDLRKCIILAPDTEDSQQL